MNRSIRWLTLVVIVGVMALGGVLMGCDSDNNQTSDNTPVGSNSDDQSQNVEPTPTRSNTQQDANATSDNTAGQNTETTSTTDNQNTTTDTNNNQASNIPSEEDLINVLIGDSLIDVDKIEIRQLEVSDNEEGIRLDDWLRKQAPEASRSIIRRWLREDRVAVNNQLIGQASYPLAPTDQVAFSFTEFSAMKIHVNELLANPAREEYDLFLLTITGKYIKDNHVQYLGVGPLFSNDIANIPASMQGKNSLPVWERSFLTAEFGEYRFYELE